MHIWRKIEVADRVILNILESVEKTAKTLLSY